MGGCAARDAVTDEGFPHQQQQGNQGVVFLKHVFYCNKSLKKLNIHHVGGLQLIACIHIKKQNINTLVMHS